jgi:hypothetical protein
MESFVPLLVSGVAQGQTPEQDSLFLQAQTPSSRGASAIPMESERKLLRDVPIDQHHPVPRRMPMTVKTMEDLFVETLKDIYFAERHILKALPAWLRRRAPRSFGTPSTPTAKRRRGG